MIEPDTQGERDAFEAAVTARHRRPLIRMRVDWTRDGYTGPLADISEWVESVEVERSRTSDLPSEVGLIDGYTSAETTATLVGRNADREHVVDALSPWNERSPLFGVPTVAADTQVDLGLGTAVGPVLLRQFTGQLRSVDIDHTNREVELSALDPAEELRAVVTLPAGSLGRSTFEANRRGYPWTTNTQWAFDYVLRRNNVFASPPPPAENVGTTIFSATLHGSHVAEIASQTFSPRSARLLPSYDGPYYRVEHDEGGTHPHGMLAPMGLYDPDNSPSCQYICDGQLWTIGAGTGFGVSLLGVLGDGPSRGDTAALRTVLITPYEDAGRYYWDLHSRNDGGVELHLVVDGALEEVWAISGAVVGESRQWRNMSVFVEFTAADEAAVTFQWDNLIRDFGPRTIPPPPTDGMRAASRVSLYHTIPMTNVYVWLAPTRPAGGAWPNADHVSQAELDVGMNELTAIPQVVAAESWALLQEISASEYGLFGFDERGLAFFRSRETLTAESGEIVRELTTTASIKELASEVNADTIRNSIVWRAQPTWYSNKLDTVFEAEEQREFNVVPGVTTFDIPLDAGVIITDGENTVPQWDAEFWQDNESEILHGFAAQRNASGDDVEAYVDPPLVELWWEIVGPRMGRLTVVNNAGERINLAAAGDGRDGDPALKLGGVRIVPGVESVGEVERPGSIAVYGTRGFEMEQSPWRQLIGPQARVAGSLLASVANPVPVIEDVPIVGDPRLEIGDLVRLTDRDRLSVRASVAKTVHGAARRDGLYSTVSVRPLAPPGLGLLDDDRRGVLDDTLILAP